jgi:hypothetical protein
MRETLGEKIAKLLIGRHFLKHFDEAIMHISMKKVMILCVDVLGSGAWFGVLDRACIARQQETHPPH